MSRVGLRVDRHARSRRSAALPWPLGSRRARRSRAGSTGASARCRRRHRAAPRRCSTDLTCLASRYAESGSSPSARPRKRAFHRAVDLHVLDVVRHHQLHDVVEHTQVAEGSIAGGALLADEAADDHERQDWRRDEQDGKSSLRSHGGSVSRTEVSVASSAIVRDRRPPRRRVTRSTAQGCRPGSGRRSQPPPGRRGAGRG